MNRFLFLLFVALITFGLVFFVKNPDALENIWLWLIGFAGGILRFGQEIYAKIKEGLKKILSKEEEQTNSNAIESQSVTNNLKHGNFDGLKVQLVRVSQDYETTIGMLYLNGQFTAYTIEDRSVPQKMPGAGRYQLELLESENEVTLDYQQLFPSWFTQHIVLRNKDNSLVYIHCGLPADMPEEGIMVTDSLDTNLDHDFHQSCKNAYSKVYIPIREALQNSRELQFVISTEIVQNQNLKAS